MAHAPPAPAQQQRWRRHRQRGKPAITDAQQSKLVTAMLSLYDDTTTDTDAVIDEHYTPDCVFQDPIICAKGAGEVKAQLRATRALFLRSYAEVISCARATTDPDRLLVVNYNMHLWPRLYPWKVDVLATMHLRLDPASGRIAEHTDHWSVLSALSSLPIVGTLAALGRRVLAKTIGAGACVTDMVFRSTRGKMVPLVHDA